MGAGQEGGHQFANDGPGGETLVGLGLSDGHRLLTQNLTASIFSQHHGQGKVCHLKRMW